MSMETRELRYFLAVAGELHFGRAAQGLGIAQPPLSRAIRQLERRLGVTLFERTHRSVTLTPAGEVLVAEGTRALHAMTAAARLAQRAGQAEPRLVLVMKPGGDGGLLPDILDAYGSDPGALPVDVICAFEERTDMLRDGRADLGLLHLPYNDIDGLDVEELLVERQVVVLPREHRLAGQSSVCLADLRGETMPRWPGVPAGELTGPVVHDPGQLMQLIALGRTIAVLPESVLGHLRADLVAVPAPDAQPTTVVLAWPEHTRSPAVAGFVRAASLVAASKVAARV